MKKVGMQMSILMGVTLSFCLSLFGTLHSGHFTVPGFLISFVVSTIISLIIGFLVPIPKLEAAVCQKAKVEQRSLKGNALTAVISDLLYTVIITLAAVFLAYQNLSKAGGELPPFIMMYISSLIPSLLVGYALIFVLKPLFLKLVLKKNGINPAQQKPDDTPQS